MALLGPLWPEGTAIDGRHLPPIHVYIDPGDASTELIAELYANLDALYRSLGGSGLKFVNDERRMPIEVEVEV